MKKSKLGLRHVASDRLRALLRLVYARKIAAPLTRPALMLAGLSDIGDDVAILIGLDEAGLRAALVIALAERDEGTLKAMP